MTYTVGVVTMKRRTILFLLIVTIALLAGCGSKSSNVSLKQAPSDVASLYKGNCIRCHATDLSGKMGDATNLQQVYTRLSQEEIAAKISGGGETMPAFSERLSEEEIDRLAVWLAKQE